MKYLLDINVLLAFWYEHHVHSARVAQWVRLIKTIETDQPPFATCAIVELGFIRIASGKSAMANDLTVALSDLRHLRAVLRLRLINDELDGNQLPNWVTRSKQTTDGHLLELASRHGMRFATLDGGIPGALLIPEYDDPVYTDPPSKVQESAAPAYGAAA